MSKDGYIKLSRRFFDNPLWTEHREYSRAEAWIDLIKSAEIDSSSVILNGRVIEVQRGEIIASRRYLEARWKWGSSKVTNFLEMLKLSQMITVHQTSGQTMITLCNYERYNGTQTTEQTRDKPPTNQGQTTDKPNLINIRTKELKNNKKIIDGDDIALSSQNDLSKNQSTISDPKTKESCEKESCEKEKDSDAVGKDLGKKCNQGSENFKKFQKWILDNAPQVAKFKEPFTQTQFEKLKIDFDLKAIQDLLVKMHNYKPLLTKNISANLTFRNWASREKLGNYEKSANSNAAAKQIGDSAKRHSTI